MSTSTAPSISVEDAQFLVRLTREQFTADYWRPVTVDNIAFALRMSREDTAAALQRLEAAGLIEHSKVDLHDRPGGNRVDGGFDIYRYTGPSPVDPEE